MRIGLWIAGIVGAFVGIVSGFVLIPGVRQQLGSLPTTETTGQARVGGAFRLRDRTGRIVTEQALAGRVSLITFAYATCDAPCAATLQVMAASVAALGTTAEQVLPVVIGIDPGRDTPATFATYVARFDPRFVALSGTDEEIASVSRAYHVQVQRVRDPVTGRMVPVDSFTLIYLMGRNGQYIGHFSSATPVGEVTDAITRAAAKSALR